MLIHAISRCFVNRKALHFVLWSTEVYRDLLLLVRVPLKPKWTFYTTYA